MNIYLRAFLCAAFYFCASMAVGFVNAVLGFGHALGQGDGNGHSPSSLAALLGMLFYILQPGFLLLSRFLRAPYAENQSTVDLAWCLILVSFVVWSGIIGLGLAYFIGRFQKSPATTTKDA